MDDDTEEESYDWKYSKNPEVSEMQEKNDEDSFTPGEESSDSQKINMFEEDINLGENEKEEAKEDEKIDSTPIADENLIITADKKDDDEQEADDKEKTKKKSTRKTTAKKTTTEKTVAPKTTTRKKNVEEEN